MDWSAEMSAAKKNAPSVAAEMGRNQKSDLSKTNTGSAVYPIKTGGSRTDVILAQRESDLITASQPPIVSTSKERIDGLKALVRRSPGADTITQTNRTLEVLRHFPCITTHELRQYADIGHPGARIWDLRHRYGYQIDKRIVLQLSPCGRHHKFAQYTLMHDEAML